MDPTTGKRVRSPCNSDDEDALLVESESDRLSWRSDSEENHSDWTIIVSVDGKHHSTYHVHRVILSFGSKKSKYFESLFRNKEMKEHEACTSKIDLHDLAAKAFPSLLDFLYSCFKKDPITADTSAALYHLGEFLEIPSIRSAVRAFWEKGLFINRRDLLFGTRRADVGHHVVCFEHCKALNCTKGCDVITDTMLKTLPDHIGDTKFLVDTSHELWLELLRKNGGKPHLALSDWVANYCMQQKHRIDVSLFQQLTSVFNLPKLRQNAAMILLEIEKDIIPGYVDGGKLSPLAERCVETIAAAWEALNQPDWDFTRLSPSLKSKIMARSLVLADASRDENFVCEVIQGLQGMRISGATGIPEVNGEYILSYSCTDDGVWRFESLAGLFQVWCFPDSDGTYSWTIQTFEEKSLYLKNVQGLQPPPKRGWTMYDDGANVWRDAPELVCSYW